jgi:hypothetical protein
MRPLRWVSKSHEKLVAPVIENDGNF